MKTRIKLLKKPFGAKLNEHLFAVYVISITKAPKTTVRKQKLIFGTQHIMAFTTQHDETMSKKQSTCQEKIATGSFPTIIMTKTSLLRISYRQTPNTRTDQFNLVEEDLYITLLELQLNIRLNREISCNRTSCSVRKTHFSLCVTFFPEFFKLFSLSL